MVLHHLATLFVLLCAYRFGFARVGVAVIAMHDVSDLPIDSIRIAQALELQPLLYLSAAISVVSWASLRAYAFPRYIILSALVRSPCVISHGSKEGLPIGTYEWRDGPHAHSTK